MLYDLLNHPNLMGAHRSCGQYEKYGKNCMQIAKILSTQTPAQLKKHAECFFKQNLKTNSAAVKWYQESLFPNEKAKILVKHAAEQQKYQQSLSPENKVQILYKDVDAHRKQCKSLPPEKKIKMLETDAAAHKKQCKSFPPDDKVQILNKDADAHKKNVSLFHLQIKINSKSIILLHDTNIASRSLLIKKLKY